LEIALNPADEIVTASEIKLRFDSSVIEITDIKPNTTKNFNHTPTPTFTTHPNTTPKTPT
jgi:hypothetical protein